MERLVCYSTVHGMRLFKLGVCGNTPIGEYEAGIGLLRVFQKYDKGTKSLYRAPTARLENYRDLIEGTFPKAIAF